MAILKERTVKTMKIQVMSDLHLDFYTEPVEKLVKYTHTDADILIIAGDFMESRNEFGDPEDSLNFKIDHFINFIRGRSKKIIRVLGNHEYYGSSKEKTLEVMSYIKTVWKKSMFPRDFIWLENKTKIIKIGKEKQRFVGCTLWFPEDPMAQAYKSLIGDFLVIKDFEKWVYDVNKRSLEFLRKTVKPDDVVITHHIPLIEGTDPRWRTAALTPFFVCKEAEEIIRKNKPKLWIYGHTHDSHDFVVDQTRLVCNPYGYYPGGLNKNFNPKLIIDV